MHAELKPACGKCHIGGATLLLVFHTLGIGGLEPCLGIRLRAMQCAVASSEEIPACSQRLAQRCRRLAGHSAQRPVWC
jgi:hypothetical protein